MIQPRKKTMEFSRKSVFGNFTEELELHICKGGTFGFPKWLQKLLGNQQPFRLHLDHPRHFGNIAYFEPYGLSQQHVAFLLRFCEEHKLHFSMIGCSHHYPSRTLRVVVWRTQDADKLRNIEHWYNQ